MVAHHSFNCQNCQIGGGWGEIAISPHSASRGAPCHSMAAHILVETNKVLCWKFEWNCWNCKKKHVIRLLKKIVWPEHATE